MICTASEESGLNLICYSEVLMMFFPSKMVPIFVHCGPYLVPIFAKGGPYFGPY